MDENLITLEKQTDDKYKLPSVMSDELLKSEGVYLIVKQPDGNYVGEATKNGQLIVVRDIGPETVLQKLLTHPGV